MYLLSPHISCVSLPLDCLSYRLGFLGFAASMALEESNRVLGEEGVGNYGMPFDKNGKKFVDS